MRKFTPEKNCSRWMKIRLLHAERSRLQIFPPNIQWSIHKKKMQPQDQEGQHVFKSGLLFLAVVTWPPWLMFHHKAFFPLGLLAADATGAGLHCPRYAQEQFVLTGASLGPFDWKVGTLSLRNVGGSTRGIVQGSRDCPNVCARP